mmetsp:Transcript_109718/g.318989  ORF Transcript_109718/g.318989 Transcript_109718/m.318989 type:complete len:223 (-) Transcript_109718:618-1286(-)
MLLQQCLEQLARFAHVDLSLSHHPLLTLYLSRRLLLALFAIYTSQHWLRLHFRNVDIEFLVILIPTRWLSQTQLARLSSSRPECRTATPRQGHLQRRGDDFHPNLLDSTTTVLQLRPPLNRRLIAVPALPLESKRVRFRQGSHGDLPCLLQQHLAGNSPRLEDLPHDAEEICRVPTEAQVNGAEERHTGVQVHPAARRALEHPDGPLVEREVDEVLQAEHDN